MPAKAVYRPISKVTCDHLIALLHCQAGLACLLSHPACCITNIAVNQLPIFDFVAQASEMVGLCRHMAPLVLSFPFPRTASSYRLGFTCCATTSATFGDISKFDRFIPTWTLQLWLFSEQGSESCTYCFSKGAPELCLQAVMHHRGPG